MKCICWFIVTNLIALFSLGAMTRDYQTGVPKLPPESVEPGKPLFKPKIVPKPRLMEVNDGYMEITSKSKLVVADKELLPLARYLSDYLNRLTGFQISIDSKAAGKGDIMLSTGVSGSPEAYRLKVDKHALLEGANYQAVALASSSLLQVIRENGGKYFIPRLSVEDEPQYDYRAVMLDLARFWHPVKTIEETIDLLWFYKIKYLHLHLSDNRRFTFPVKEYPELRKINPDGSREYYTRDELSHLVEYARQRGVMVIPEVDLPGHSQALWKRLPDIFGARDPETGKAKNLYVVNMAKENTYQAIESIIGQLAEVFYTSSYIHIGGDEVWLKPIQELPEYKTYCEKHGLKAALAGDANELFCHFINRLNQMVKKTGKQTIAWEGFHGLGAGNVLIDKDITVIVWNTTYNRPDSLLRNGFKIINSTWIPWYQVSAMNFAPEPDLAYQWDLGNWQHWNGDIADIRLANKTGIIGGQISFWEQNYNRVIEVLKDRVPVLADRLWNNDGTKDYDDYLERSNGTKQIYRQLFRPISITGSNLTQAGDLSFEDKTNITLTAGNKGTIRYAFADQWGLPPDSAYKTYTNPFPITKSGLVSAQLFDDEDKAIGYPVQKYFTAIQPVYQYKVYKSANGAEAMPDFGALPVLREGVSGKMTENRLHEINRELFAKVKPEGHIDVRFEGLYNPYAVKLTGNLEIPSDGKYEWQLQTWDGLAALYIDGKLIAKGENFENKPEVFTAALSKGKYPFMIKYYYKHIQNQLSILYRMEGDDDFKHFEELVLPRE